MGDSHDIGDLQHALVARSAYLYGHLRVLLVVECRTSGHDHTPALADEMRANGDLH
jgi:hypothetical protein